jgi:hypothetical protein
MILAARGGLRQLHITGRVELPPNEGGTGMSTTYEQIPESAVPATLVWTAETASRNSIVRTEYSTGRPAGQGGNYEACDGDPYMRVTDDSDGSVTYYKAARA